MHDCANRHKLYRPHGGQNTRRIYVGGNRAYGFGALSTARRICGCGRDGAYKRVWLSPCKRSDARRAGRAVRGAHRRPCGGKRGRYRGGNFFFHHGADLQIAHQTQLRKGIKNFSEKCKNWVDNLACKR